MPANCAYSFADLYLAAHGKPPTHEVLTELYSLPQEERNLVVRRWAEAAGWEVTDVRGSDGTIYASFGPGVKDICRG